MLQKLKQNIQSILIFPGVLRAKNRINELITNSGERCRFDHGDDGSESVRALYPP